MSLLIWVTVNALMYFLGYNAGATRRYDIIVDGLDNYAIYRDKETGKYHWYTNRREVRL